MEKVRRPIFAIALVLLILVAVSISFFLRNQDSASAKIRNKLVGYEISYSGIDGNTLYFEVGEENIKYIKETDLNGAGWEVSVNDDGLAWLIYFEESGETIIKTEQLFVS